MKKAEALFEKWTTLTPKEARRQDVIIILNHFFHDQWDWESGSHIVVRCHDFEPLRTFGQYRDFVEFSIPVKSGKKVKGFYIKHLINAVKLLKELRELQK